MKTLNRWFIALALAPAALLASPSSRAASCSSAVGHHASISLASPHISETNFAGGTDTSVSPPVVVPAGSLDSTPLLSETIKVPGVVGDTKTATCAVAHLSVFTAPIDNMMVFQVTVDGVPMQGHYKSTGYNGVPYVSETNETALGDPTWRLAVDAPRMASFTFFKGLTPGTHQVEVRIAACCSTDIASSKGHALLSNATLTVDY